MARDPLSLVCPGSRQMDIIYVLLHFTQHYPTDLYARMSRDKALDKTIDPVMSLFDGF